MSTGMVVNVFLYYLLLVCLLEGRSFKRYIYSNVLGNEKPAGLKNCTNSEVKNAVMGGLVYKMEKGVCVWVAFHPSGAFLIRSILVICARERIL